MSGNTNNAKIWAGADVFVAWEDEAATAPADVSTPWATGWNAAGLLDPEEGFTESREDESNEFFAWGGVLVKKTKSRHKRTIKFVALEDNDTTFRLVNPGSTRTQDGTSGLTVSTVKVPKYEDFQIGFETTDGDEVRRRVVERAGIEEIGEIKDSETELTVYEITVVLYPDGEGTLYTELSGPAE
jgi:hypothetical protein